MIWEVGVEIHWLQATIYNSTELASVETPGTAHKEREVHQF